MFCLLIIFNPVQLTECGHRQCQSCVNSQHRTTIKCRQCSIETQRNKLMIDRGFKRDMQLIPIECCFCQWTGVLNNYQKHLDEFHSNPKCEYCDKQFRLDQEATSLKEKINDMQHISYDGTFVWKITNVKEKMIDAQSERQTSIDSPPFNSSPTGYKMRARLYLYGDGNGRRTHISLFFVLMKSEYDPILTFPFNYKVAFCMYDQTDAKRHIIDSFRPDITSNSFQRPQSDMNIASGIPKFFPLAMIEQEGNPYVQDDTMLIQIMVDFYGMPNTLLDYAVSLNPWLPPHVHQEKIREILERGQKK